MINYKPNEGSILVEIIHNNGEHTCLPIVNIIAIQTDGERAILLVLDGSSVPISLDDYESLKLLMDQYHRISYILPKEDK